MTPFHVGMKVVCVDDEPHSRFMPSGSWNANLNGLKRGSVYTISSVGESHVTGRPNLWLLELPRPDGLGFSIFRFRLAYENRMDELRSLLVPTPSKAKTKERA